MAKATKKFIYHFNGGPYEGMEFPLTTPSTLVFTVCGMTGRYRPGAVHYPSNRDKLYSVNAIMIPVEYEGFMGFDLIWEKK